MSKSGYFSTSRVTRSKLLSSDANTQTHDDKTGIPHTSRSQHHTDAKCHRVGTLCGKLRRKREHIKIDNDYNAKVYTEEAHTSTLNKTDLKLTDAIIKEEKHYVEPGSDNNRKWEPSVWKRQLDNIYEIRQARDAPVDTMGCDVISDNKAPPEVIN